MKKTKMISLVLTILTLVSLIVPAVSALTSDPNFSTPQFTYMIQMGSDSVDVYVGPADVNYILTGYTDLTDANSAVITAAIMVGDDIVTIADGGGVSYNGMYLRKYTATKIDPISDGPASINFTAANNSYVDVTVIVESEKSMDYIANNIQTAINDTTETFLAVLAGPNTVYSPASSLDGPFYDQFGVAQTYCTPIVALYDLIPMGIYDIDLTDITYVAGIAGYDAFDDPTDMVKAAGWEGWMYQAYDSSGAQYPAAYSNIGAAAFRLSEGDHVYWKYGMYGMTFPLTWDEVLIEINM